MPMAKMKARAKKSSQSSSVKVNKVGCVFSGSVSIPFEAPTKEVAEQIAETIKTVISDEIAYVDGDLRSEDMAVRISSTPSKKVVAEFARSHYLSEGMAFDLIDSYKGIPEIGSFAFIENNEIHNVATFNDLEVAIQKNLKDVLAVIVEGKAVKFFKFNKVFNPIKSRMPSFAYVADDGFFEFPSKKKLMEDLELGDNPYWQPSMLIIDGEFIDYPVKIPQKLEDLDYKKPRAQDRARKESLR
jgi:hypothetical protein